MNDYERFSSNVQSLASHNLPGSRHEQWEIYKNKPAKMITANLNSNTMLWSLPHSTVKERLSKGRLSSSLPAREYHNSRFIIIQCYNTAGIVAKLCTYRGVQTEVPTSFVPTNRIVPTNTKN